MTIVDRVRSAIHRATKPKKASVEAACSTSSSQDRLPEVQVARNLSRGITGAICNEPRFRHVLVDISQKEDGKNSYYAGLQTRLANDRVGTGIKVRCQIPNREDWNKEIQLKYNGWKRAAKITTKYGTAVREAGVTGELVGVKYTNETIRNPVKLDYMFIDCRRLTDGYRPDLSVFDDRHVDGIDFDKDWNPTTYYISPANQKIGGTIQYGMLAPPKPYKADEVIHWFYPWCTEQKRGIPQTTPALLLYPQLRRYTEAVIRAAELSASIVFSLETNSTAMPVENEDGAFSCYDIEPGMIQQMPDGWMLKSTKAEQPTQTYQAFKKEIVAESAMSVNMPYIIAAGDAGEANFSSANVDWEPYETSTKIIRNQLACDLEDELFSNWYSEAILLEGYLSPGIRQMFGTAEEIPHDFGFDRLHKHVDPLKGSKAVEVALASGETTLTEVWEEKGLDVRQALEEEARLLGITYDELTKLILTKRYALGTDEITAILIGETE